VLGREPRPVRFVVSLRLGEPASLEPVRTRLASYPGLRFKLDVTASWTDELCRALAETGAVDSIDFKGCYGAEPREDEAGPELYPAICRHFPTAWLEDPRLGEANDAALGDERMRITWDAPIHSVADIEALPFPPRMVNVKPSRFGTLERLLAAYDHCAAHGIGIYGGGQFELGVGREHLHYLASLFHPDGPNDIAPGGYNDPEPVAGLPPSPLVVRPADMGFRLAGNR
jgi:hypothetical protein